MKAKVLAGVVAVSAAPLRSLSHFAFILMAAASFSCTTSSVEAAPESIVTFCKAQPDLDFPERTSSGLKQKGGIPKEVVAAGGTNWRCMNGKVYVCNGGASGSACAKMDPSLRPSKAIRETCEDNPDQSFVAIAAIGNSSSTWRCQGRTAEIIKTVPLDARGFMKGTWAPLFDVRGAVNVDMELGADPR